MPFGFPIPPTPCRADDLTEEGHLDANHEDRVFAIEQPARRLRTVDHDFWAELIPLLVLAVFVLAAGIYIGRNWRDGEISAEQARIINQQTAIKNRGDSSSMPDAADTH